MKRSKSVKGIGARVIAEVARREGESVEYIRLEMKKAMQAAMNNPDPRIRELWRQIPCKGDAPEPEEFIVYVAGIVIQK